VLLYKLHDFDVVCHDSRTQAVINWWLNDSLGCCMRNSVCLYINVIRVWGYMLLWFKLQFLVIMLGCN